MRHSQHTDTEILYLLHEAETGISIPEICRTAHISERTFYRWRKRYGSLTQLPWDAIVRDIAAWQPHRRRRTLGP